LVGQDVLFRIDTTTREVSAEDNAKKGDWILHDGAAISRITNIANRAHDEDREQKLLLFISPRKSNRASEFIPHTLTRKIMSPCDEEEILDIWKTVYCESVSKKEVLDHFFDIGGVPRYVFELPEDIPGILLSLS
jgi:hypothetical protein